MIKFTTKEIEKKIDFLEEKIGFLEKKLIKLNTIVYCMPLYKEFRNKFYGKYNSIQTLDIDNYIIKTRYFDSCFYFTIFDKTDKENKKICLRIYPNCIEVTINSINLNTDEISNLVKEFLKTETNCHDTQNFEKELKELLN